MRWPVLLCAALLLVLAAAEETDAACTVGRNSCNACTEAVPDGPPTMCVGCAAGFNLIPAQARCNATSCSYTNGTCVRDAGVAATCAVGVRGCLTCNRARNACAKCDVANGFQLATGRCTKCMRGAGQFSDSKGACGKCPANCATCTNAKKCTVCRTGFALSKGACTTKCAVAGCATCAAGKPKECTTCAEGWVRMSATRCDRCNAQGCTTSPAAAKDECTACQAGFKFSAADKACDGCTGPEDCARFSKGCTCQACRPGFRLAGNTCAQCEVPNCQTWGDGCTCATCSPGFQLEQATNTCRECQVSGCDSYSTGCKCSAVQTGFQLVGTSGTTRCRTGLQLTASGTCQQSCTKISNCTQLRALFDPTATDRCTCATCATGFEPNILGTACVGCGKVSNCTATNDKCECTSCDPGFLLNKGSCVTCSNTTNWNDPNCRVSIGCTCLLCKPGHLLSGNKCQACGNPFCKSYPQKNSSTDGVLECECLDCQLPYQLTTDPPTPFRARSRCQCPPLPNCSTYDANCQCTKCDGYTLEQGKCRTKCTAQNCALCTSEACTVCASGFKLNITTITTIVNGTAGNNTAPGNGTSPVTDGGAGNVTAPGVNGTADSNTTTITTTITECQACPVVTNCDMYNADCSCRRCAFDSFKYFLLRKGQCECSLANPNCSKFNADGCRCDTCKTGWVEVAGICGAPGKKK